MTGAPIPYSLGTDNLVLLLFVLSLLGGAYVSVFYGSSITERIKNMFYYSGQAIPYNTRTDIGGLGNVILYAMVIFYSSITTMGYLKQMGRLHDTTSAHIQLLTLSVIFLLYLPLKRFMYDIVNKILFTKEQAKEWRESYFFTIQLTGFMLLPIAAALILLPHTPHIIYYIYMAIVGIIYLSMLFTRCFNIIFKDNCFFLDIFLYLCAIELAPLALIWRTIDVTNLYKIINF